MRVLHVIADWKWTGPAEPTVTLARGLRARGHQVALVCARAPRGVPPALRREAAQRGMAPVRDLCLGPRNDPSAWLADACRLRSWIDRHRIEVIHAHLSHDHLLAGWAARRSRARPPIVRTSYKGVPLPPRLGRRLLLRRYADAYICVSNEALRVDRERFGLDPAHCHFVETPVELGRFRPYLSPDEQCRKRAEFGLAAEHFVVGVIARMQRHRRFDVLLEAIARAHRELPHLRAVLIGRGTHRRRVAVEPSRRLGLDGTVIFTGYRRDDYLETLSCLDLKLFLVPGSDGSCRAVRECMAMGIPVLAARRGMLPEIVRHEETGLVVEDTVENLASAMITLGRNRARLRELGQAARREALVRFSPERQVEAVEEVYRGALGSRGA